MKRWRHRERLGDLIESPRGEYVLFDEAERYGGSEYARGYMNGSGDEGHYQREISRLKADRHHASSQLENVARWLDNGCDPAMAARELRLIAAPVDRSREPQSEPTK